MEVHLFLLMDWMKSMEEDITTLLNSGVKVLVYSGDKDFICNWRGGEKWTHEAVWDHSDEFKKASYVDWNVNNEVAG